MGLLFIYGGLIFLFWWGFHKMNKDEERSREEGRRYLAQQKELERKQEEEARKTHETRMLTDPMYAYQYREKQRKEQERIERERRAREEAARKAEEEKRQAEIKRRNELKAKFHYITLGGFSAAYRYDYYPKNRYPYVDSDAESNRCAVWNFKDGASSIGVRILSDFLDGNYTKSQMSNLVLCVIPASTAFKNSTRYSSMCNQVSEKYSITNGFNYIQIIYDRTDSRTQKSSDTIGNLSFSSSVYGKDVILFDDITTRGTSFIQVANELKKKGARSVYGVFIGRTVWE